MQESTNNSTVKDAIKSLGIVFGDIGTSPIYTFSAIFAVIPSTVDNVMGIVSAIIWTITLLVTGQYAWLAMSLGKERNGEGGTIILREILVSLLKSRSCIVIVTFLSFLGISFFIGDGVITPAISILSAVEGLQLIPMLSGLPQQAVMLVAIAITIALFACQKYGTEKISLAFGPIMLVWFLFLALSGALAIAKFPYILHAISPHYAIQFFLTHKIVGLLLLSKIILAATGSETLYTDMGHIGRKPIIHAWLFVFPILCLTYLGQGAYLINSPTSHSIFHHMTLSEFKLLYIPILLLSIAATIVASQAMITGLFSVVYQGITTRLIPPLHIEYTSKTIISQIFIPSINRFLAFFVIVTILLFKNSENLANAYGIAVSGTMTITSILLTCIFYLRRNLIKAAAACGFIMVNSLFLISNVFKIPYGGYWSLMIACIPLTIIIIYTFGQRRLYKRMRQIPCANFLDKYSILSQKVPSINGTALFLAKSTENLPYYIVSTMFTNNILYEENIIVKVETQKTAFGTNSTIKDLKPGLKLLEIKVGYLELVNIEKILRSEDIYPKVIFYGVEDFTSQNPFWKLYILIKKLTPSFVQFYKFPASKLHGVVVQVTL